MLLKRIKKYLSLLPRHQNIILIMHPRCVKQISWTRLLQNVRAKNRVEELCSPPVILNLLTASVQTSGKKWLILNRGTLIFMFLTRNLSAKACIPLVTSFQNIILFFPSIQSLGITMLTFFLSIAHLWLSPRTLARVSQ